MRTVAMLAWHRSQERFRLRPKLSSLHTLGRLATASLCCALALCMSAASVSAQTTAPPAAESPSQSTGQLVVREKQGLAIRVLIDGVDRGAAPLTIDLPLGSYEVSGLASTLFAPPKQVTLDPNTAVEVVIEAVPAMARIEVRTSDGQGSILIDGRPVGQGSFDGDLAVGEHVLTVERDGFEPYTKTLRLGQGQVVVESVTLERRADSTVEAGGTAHRVRDGIYGGVQLGLAFMPSGSDNTIDTGCSTIGATSCDPSNPWGAIVQGYVGYALEPLGFELLVGVLGDKATPQAYFDGEHGSSINPLVAQPARDEKFEIYRAGILSAVRVRGNLELDWIRLYGAMGAGFSWKKMGLMRTVTTTDGTDATNEFAPELVSYWSPGVTLDVGAYLPIGESTGLTAGAWFWAETARNDARTEAEPQRVIASDDGPPRPLATPQYDLANGDQIYIGPYVGIQFGP